MTRNQKLWLLAVYCFGMQEPAEPCQQDCFPPQSINFIATLNRIKPRSTGGMPFQQKCSKLCSTNTSGLKPERLYCRSSQLEAVGI